MKTHKTTTVNSLFDLFLLTVLSILLAGCSSSPSAGDGEKVVQDRIKQESEGRIKLNKFQKTNGAEGQLMGFKIYALEFDVEIEFTENCKWLRGGLGQQLGFQTAKPPVQQSGVLAQFAEASFNPGDLVQTGQRVQLSGVVRFVKKEKGWTAEGVDLLRASLIGQSSAPQSTTPSNASASANTDPLPPRQRGASANEKRGCIVNLRSILGAMRVWRLEFRKSDNDTPTDADLFGADKTIAKKPECPSGGIYTLGNADRLPSCSLHGASQEYSSANPTGPGFSEDAIRTFKYFREKANAGDRKAQYELAVMYETGEGVEKSPRDAFKWFQTSAEQGYAPSQAALGAMLARSKDVPKNEAEAVRWFRTAAEQGDTHGQLNLGSSLMEGKGVRQDQAEAVKWFKKAADTGSVHGQVILGSAYENGLGVEKNLAEAVVWYRKAAEQGDSLATDKVRELTRTPDEEARDASLACVSHLKQIALAARMWSNDHKEKFPFNLHSYEGGTKELSSRGDDGFEVNATPHFQVMSNELNNPKILVCPADTKRSPASDFRSLHVGNVTYQLRSGANVSELYPDELLARCPIHGHAVYCDGAVKARGKF